MTAKKNNELIGFDPLSWMNESDSNPTAEQPSQVEEKPEDTKEATTSANLDSAEITLNSVLNIQGVSELKEQMLLALQSYEHIAIDASNVKNIDTATIQLFLFCKQQAVQMQKTFSFDFPSEQFIETAQLLNVAEMLGIDSPGSGLF